MGEHPTAADTVGIRVLATRYRNVILGGLIAGIGGAYLTVGSVGTFSKDMSSGLGYIALRNRAPIVPVIFGGNHELYWGRRIVMRVLPLLDPLDLAGLDPGSALPPEGSSAERAAVHRLTAALAERVGPAVADVHARSEPRSGTRKRGQFLTKMFR